MFSVFVSYTPVQRYKEYNWSATGPKKTTINNQKSKTVKRMAEVWQQLPEEDCNAVMAMATASGIIVATGTSTAMAMAMVTVTVTAMVTATAMGVALATTTAMVTGRAMGTAMAVAAAVAKDMAED
jgi:hypothetical protein